MVIKFVKVLPLNRREYTDRNGQSAVFRTKPFIVANESGQIYVEAIQEQADALEALDIHEGDCAFAQISTTAREYKTQSGDVRYANEITLTKCVMI